MKITTIITDRGIRRSMSVTIGEDDKANERVAQRHVDRLNRGIIRMLAQHYGLFTVQAPRAIYEELHKKEVARRKK